MYQHVLAPLDGSELAECVLPHVEVIATGCNISRITLIRIVTPLRLYGGIETHISPGERQHLEADSIEVATQYLEEHARKLREKGAFVETKVLFGKITEELIEYVTDNEVDLVVIATHGRSGVSKLFLGSTAERILHASPVPVLMVHAPGHVPQGV